MIEDLTVAAYLLAGLVLLPAARSRRGFARLAMAVLAVGMAVVAGEEISWGQRLLGYAMPDFLSQNSQGEANVHNLRSVGRLLREANCGLLLLACVLAVAGALEMVLSLEYLATLAGGPAVWLAFAGEGQNALLLILGSHGALAARACGAVVPLPDYPIERIRTGVWNFKEELWQVQVRRTTLPGSPTRGHSGA